MTAAGAVNRLTSFGENPLDLLVQLVAVGDDDNTGIRVVFQYPLRQQHHDNALAAALGVPDDAALVGVHKLLRGPDAEILMDAGQFLDAAIEQHEIIHQLDQPLFAAHFQQILVQLEATIVLLVFLPFEEILFRRTDAAVLQPLGVVAREDETSCGCGYSPRCAICRVPR